MSTTSPFSLSAVDVGAGRAIIEEAELDNVAMTFGHGARHLVGTPLTQAEVEAAIDAVIRGAQDS